MSNNTTTVAIGEAEVQEFAALVTSLAVSGDHETLCRAAAFYIRKQPELLAAAVVGLAESGAHMARELEQLRAVRFVRTSDTEDGGS